MNILLQVLIFSKLLGMDKKTLSAHVLAVFTMMMWGTSFVISKLALQYLTPMQILFWRECVAIVALFLISPHFLKWQGWKTELLMFLGSMASMTVYQLLENYAVSLSKPSNASVIVSTAPFFTLIVVGWIFKEKNGSPWFYAGFVIAMTGICMFSFTGGEITIGMIGDLLALAAAFSWGFYQAIIKALSQSKIPQAQMTRRLFIYGALTLLPFELAGITKEQVATTFSSPVIFYILFLGGICSGLCFLTWNYAIKYLGAVESSVYIYLNPITTLIFSAIILSEKLTAIQLCGVVFAMAGLIISTDDSRKAFGSLFKRK